jgi:hypothetical protein
MGSSRRKERRRENFQFLDHQDQPIRPKILYEYQTPGIYAFNTYSSDIWVLNPRLEDQRSYAMNDNDGIVVLRCDRRN